MSDNPSQRRTTRRDALKLAGAAALGAAGAAALGAPRVLAAGSGNAIVNYFDPTRIIDTRGSAKIGHGADATVGPFAYPGSTTFTSEDYYGMIGNLTAVSWTGTGWLAVRPDDATFSGVSNLNFWGSGPAWANMFICRFGTTGIPLNKVSNGKIKVRSGAATTNFIVDVFAFLGPDQ
jgi:hypothetical protein